MFNMHKISVRKVCALVTVFVIVMLFSPNEAFPNPQAPPPPPSLDPTQIINNAADAILHIRHGVIQEGINETDAGLQESTKFAGEIVHDLSLLRDFLLGRPVENPASGSPPPSSSENPPPKPASEEDVPSM